MGLLNKHEPKKSIFTTLTCTALPHICHTTGGEADFPEVGKVYYAAKPFANSEFWKFWRVADGLPYKPAHSTVNSWYTLSPCRFILREVDVIGAFTEAEQKGTGGSMMAQQRFHLGDILTITTGFLVSPDGIEGVYRLLDYMTRDNLYTHQLPRAAEQCRPHLERQFLLMSASVMQEQTTVLRTLLQACTEREQAPHVVLTWLAEQITRLGEWHDVQRLPLDDYTPVDPIEEAIQMVGEDKVIVVRPPEVDDREGGKP